MRETVDSQTSPGAAGQLRRAGSPWAGSFRFAGWSFLAMFLLTLAMDTDAVLRGNPGRAVVAVGAVVGAIVSVVLMIREVREGSAGKGSVGQWLAAIVLDLGTIGLFVAFA